MAAACEATHGLAGLVGLAAREHIKPEALWEHDQAQGTNVMDLMRASEARSTFLQQLLAPFERADVRSANAGRHRSRACQWTPADAGMEVTLYATFAGLPAISMPAVFIRVTAVPVALQLIGRPPIDELMARRPVDPA